MTSLPPTLPASPAPARVPADRLAGFGHQVAARLRAGAAHGQGEPVVIPQMVVEQVALAKALSDHDFVHAMASGYIAQMGSDARSGVLNAAIPMEQAHRQMESILRNRVADAKTFVRALADPTFIAAIRAEAAQPALPEKPYQLPPRKVDEIVRRFVQPTDVDGPEPAIHVAQSAEGHRLGHQALAAIFNPAGPLRAPLVHALANAWPQGTGDVLEAIASAWLKARQEPAQAVADGLKPDGIIYQQAMAQAEALQLQKLGGADAGAPAAPRAPNVPAAAPAPTISGAGKEHRGTVRDVADLALEVV